MSPTLTISESLFARLQAHAVAFVDTPETVIGRALDALDGSKGRPTPPAVSGPREFNPEVPPTLALSALRKATIGGVALQKSETTWAGLMHACVREAAKKGLTPHQIVDLLFIPCVVGQKEDKGYTYIRGADVSVQGQAIHRAWKQINELARAVGLTLTVEFTWQSNEKAAMPNVTGIFRVN